MLAAEMGEVIQDAPPIRVAGCALTWELGSCWKHQKGLSPPLVCPVQALCLYFHTPQEQPLSRAHAASPVGKETCKSWSGSAAALGGARLRAFLPPGLLFLSLGVRSHVGRGWSCDAFEYFTFRQFPISQPPASRLSGSCYSHGETRAVGDSRNSSSEGAAAGRTPRRSHAHPLPAPGAAHAAPHGESPG